MFPSYRNQSVDLQSKSLVVKGLERLTLVLINPFQSTVTFHIETNHLICTANQMTGFYMKCKTGVKWVKGKRIFPINIKRLGIINIFNIFNCYISYRNQSFDLPCKSKDWFLYEM